MADEVVPVKTRKKAEFKRKGPPCITCGRSMPVTGVPKEADALAKLEKRMLRDQKRLEIAKQSVVTKVPTPEEKEAADKAELEAKLARKAAREAKKAGVVPPVVT